MKEQQELINNLISTKDLLQKSGEEIVEEIASNLYKEENQQLTDKGILYQLPLLIRDIILIINFDTELNMEGILGFLENSSGLFLDDTIETLERIKAEDDYHILKEIRGKLKESIVSNSKSREGFDSIEEYSINSFSALHGEEYDELADDISKLADRLYLYSDDRNVFDYLINYIDANKTSLIHELE